MPSHIHTGVAFDTIVTGEEMPSHIHTSVVSDSDVTSGGSLSLVTITGII